MNLLPKSHQEFGSTDYWDKFFHKLGSKAFEWYGEYTTLCGILHKYIRIMDKILVAGCGNSDMSACMYDVGYQQIVNIDISSTVIRQMAAKHAEARPHMKYILMDMLKTEFSDSEFSVVLDKGTLDALFSDETPEVLDKVERMFKEIGRVLRIGGRYVCVSLAQQHVLRALLSYFPSNGWMTRVCLSDTEPPADDQKQFHLPVFVFVFTKMKVIPGMKQVLELTCFDDRVDRLQSVDDLISGVKDIQRYAMVRQQLNSRKITDEQLSLNLYSSASDKPRYIVHVVDAVKKCGQKYAVFIVPQGRELEWMFSSDEGRRQLQKSARFDRLAVVCLHRDHCYDSLDQIKEELSAKMMELAPADLGHTKVPYLSIGDEINLRTVRYRGRSDISGDFVVDDVQTGDRQLRRLIFLSSQNLVQTEMRLMKTNRKKRREDSSGGSVRVDLDYFSSNYYSTMISGLVLLEDWQRKLESGFSLLLIGLGGGSLPSFLHKNFSRVSLDVVELDGVIVSVAKDWFGLTTDERYQVHVTDGLQYIQEQAAKGASRDVVILDVDSKDHSSGMSCPAQSFIQSDVLIQLHNLLTPTGIFMLNLVCRSSNTRSAVLQELKLHFGQVMTIKLKDDVNEIVFCTSKSRSDSVAFDDDHPNHALTESVAQLKCHLLSANKNLSYLTLDVSDLRLR